MPEGCGRFEMALRGANDNSHHHHHHYHHHPYHHPQQAQPQAQQQQGQPQQQRAVRLKKGLVVAKRFADRGGGAAGPITPVPSWKLYENPFYYDSSAAAPAAAYVATDKQQDGDDPDDDDGDVDGLQEEERNRAGRAAPPPVKDQQRRAPSSGELIMMAGHGPLGQSPGQEAGEDAAGGRRLFVSARKLAASLWEELQEEVPISARAGPPLPPSKLIPPFCVLLDPPGASPRSHLQSRPSSISDSPDSAKQHQHHHHHQQQLHRKIPNMPSTTHSPQPPTLSPPLKTITLMRPATASDHTPLRPKSAVQPPPNQVIPIGQFTPGSLELSPEVGVIPSPHKVLNRPGILDDANASVISSLRFDLQCARARILELEATQKSARKEVESLLKRCADERSMMRNREQEKIQAAVQILKEELEKEKKARKKLEVENKKLSIHLADAGKATLQTEKELDKERKARQLMEDVCDELAKEIGEDKAEVEELKREHAKAREEMEEEHRMLQMSEAWREERVQMKLSEARVEVEQRCMALDELKFELATVLNTWKACQAGARLMQDFDASHAQSLVEAAGKLQAFASGPMHLPEDLPDHAFQSQVNTGSSEDESECTQVTRGLQLSHSRNEPEPFVNAESKWASLASTLQASEESDWEMHVPPQTHLNMPGKSWTNRRHSSRRRRNVASIRSHGSRTQDLDRMQGKDRGTQDMKDKLITGKAYYEGVKVIREDGESNELENNGFQLGVESDGDTSKWDYASESTAGLRQEGVWSADDNERGSINGNGIMWQSNSEENNGSEQSMELRKSTSRPSDSRFDKGGSTSGWPEQGHPGPAASHRKFSKNGGFYSKDESETSSAGRSPVYKQFVASPGFRGQKSSCPQVEANSHSLAKGRRVSIDAIDQSKPFRSNSLKAKLLLEDSMDNTGRQSRRIKGGKHIR